MNPLFKRFGMRWERRYPRMDWRAVWSYVAPIAVLLMALVAVSPDSSRSGYARRAASARYCPLC